MRIGIINTGGTISCVGDPLAPMSSVDFAAACSRLIDPIIAQTFPGVELEYLTDLTFPASGQGTLDSTNLQPADWCVLAERILTDYERYDGWVLLHGTDSMAYTASALPFLLSSFAASGNGTAVLSRPVILTGSQVPLFSQSEPGGELSLRFATDAYQNLCSAIAFAQTGIPEVGVAFDGHLLRGNRVLKTSADMDDAFASPDCPPIGLHGISLSLATRLLLPGPTGQDVSLDTAEVRKRALDRLRYIATRISEVTVMPFTAFPATFASGEQSTLSRLLDAVIATGIDGLILESYGEGNFPSGSVAAGVPGAVERTLRRAIQGGVLVVNCTQVISGTVDDNAYAAGAWLPQIGALGPGDMTPIAAFAKTTVLLAERGWSGNDWDDSTVGNLVRQSLFGEMKQTDKLQLGFHQELLSGQELAAVDNSARLVNDGRRGLRLMSAEGTVLWKVDADAVLQLRAEGASLVDRSGRLVWSAKVGQGHVAQQLALRGSHKLGTLVLGLYDRQSKPLVTLYAD